jgi:uncharacterized membrane protein (DUF4010 family)
MILLVLLYILGPAVPNNKMKPMFILNKLKKLLCKKIFEKI